MCEVSRQRRKRSLLSLNAMNVYVVQGRIACNVECTVKRVSADRVTDDGRGKDKRL